MYENLVPTTELEAVNALLEHIGEAPVASLTDLALDAGSALNTLRRVSREVQGKGWHWNTTYRKLTADGNGEFILPTNTITVDTVGTSYQINVTQRGGKLYDRRPFKNTTVFDETELQVKLVELLDFTDLPEPARQYIYIRAARQFQEFNLGAQSISAFSQDDEMHAQASVMDDEMSAGDYNFIESEARTLARFPIGFRRY